MADAPEVDKPDDAPELGDGGKRALDEERKARRDAERQLREARERLTEIETAQVRRDVASEKGLTDAQAKLLHGTTEEELTASADELLNAFKNPADRLHRRPVENLRGGLDPDNWEPDPRQMADNILHKGF